MLSRRTFLRQSSLIALAPTIPAFLTRTALAATPARDDRVLVIIELGGGNDGINTVVPYADPGYAKHRDKLRLPQAQLLKINDEVALHPSLRTAKELLDSGRFAVVQAVGYPNPDRSHFRSMAIWHTARFEKSEHDGYGWVGRALDPARRQAGADSIFIGAEKLPVALRGRRSVASAMLHTGDLSRVTLASPVKPQKVMTRAGNSADLMAFVQRSVLDAYTTAEHLANSLPASASSGTYPATDLAARLQLISRLIKSNLSTRVYYANLDGFDTHAVQLPTHARLLSEFSGAVRAFLDDLAGSGLAERVCVMAFSEFGRRVKENNSLGTDHGTAGPVLLAGPRVKAGVHGHTPHLEDLEAGDLKMNVDFRDVYASVLEQWLRVDSQAALGGRRPTLPLFV